MSLELDLGPGNDDWLGLLPADGEWWYWAQGDERRLALGAALHYDTGGGGRFAALGNAWAGLRRDWRGEAPDRAWFGFAFDPLAGGDLPNARLVLPALQLVSRGGRLKLVLATTAARLAAGPAPWLDLLAPAPAPSPASSLQPLPDPLGERAWLARVGAALQAIAAGTVDKVVLARSACLRSDRPISPAPLLAALLARQPDCTVYARGDGPRTFLGATPEYLVRLREGRAEADALAGTAWLAPADRPAPAPLSADKNRREQRLVEDAVAAALAPLCLGIETVAAPTILHLRQLSHLRSRIGGRVRPEVTLFDLAAALHPTPAVGGHPGPAARDWLPAHGESRGAWYSGGFGWIGRDGDGEIAVALRCADIVGNAARLWAGAGIVAGSDPAQELAETEAKLQAMVDAFRHPEPSSPACRERMARG